MRTLRPDLAVSCWVHRDKNPRAFMDLEVQLWNSVATAGHGWSTPAAVHGCGNWEIGGGGN